MKKFLSLVLALIMTMSLVTISAGATEYRDLTDKDEIQYEEAVAVLNRIGVITGYEDGSFRPETELTRGAAAKIIVSLMIGPDAASALPNNASPYPDVPAGHTFAGVIGYCKTAGYISGYGDGTFKPANPLTGYAFAKMLLGAIGYKSNVEGFVDTGWTMNVARIGNVAGLFDRLDFDGAAAVTRDEACQLALNTLKATMVDYGNANTVVSSNGEVLTVQGSKAQYVTSNNRDRTHQSLSGYTKAYVQLVSKDPNSDTGTYKLTLMGTLAAATVKVYATPAGGSAADEMPLPYSANSDGTAKTYQVPKNATVKVSLESADDTTIDTNNVGNHTVNGVTVTLVEAAKDYLTFTMSKDLNLEISAAGGAPNGGDNANRTVTIKVEDGVEAKYEEAVTNTLLATLNASNPTATVKMGGKLTVTKVTGGTAVLVNKLQVANTTTNAAQATRATVATDDKPLTTTGVITAVESNVTLRPANKLTVSGTNASVTGTVGSDNVTSITSATDSWVASSATLKASNTSSAKFTGFIVTDTAAGKVVADGQQKAPGATFTMDKAADYFVAGAYKVTFDDTVKVYDGAANTAPEITGTSYVSAAETVIAEAVSSDKVAVAVVASNTDTQKFGAQHTAGTLSEDTNFTAYTKVTLGSGTATDTVWEIPGNNPGFWKSTGLTKNEKATLGFNSKVVEKIHISSATAAAGQWFKIGGSQTNAAFDDNKAGDAGKGPEAIVLIAEKAIEITQATI